MLESFLTRTNDVITVDDYAEHGYVRVSYTGINVYSSFKLYPEDVVTLVKHLSQALQDAPTTND